MNATINILLAAQSAIERAQARQPVYQPRVYAYAERPCYVDPPEFESIDQDAADVIRAIVCPGYGED